MQPGTWAEWAGAAASLAAVIVALSFGWESKTKRKQRDEQLKTSLQYTQRMLERERRAQAGRIRIEDLDTQAQPEAIYPTPHTGDLDDVTWKTNYTVKYRVTNASDTTITDLTLRLIGYPQSEILAGTNPLTVQTYSFLQTGEQCEVTFAYTLRPHQDGQPSAVEFGPRLTFTDAAGQQWQLDEQRHLTSLD